MPLRLTYLLRNALLVPLMLLVFLGGFGDGRIVCIESDGSVSIETAASACCGRCCDTAVHECDPGAMQALSAGVSDEDCIDVPLPGQPLLCARVQAPSLLHSLALGSPVEVVVPPVFVMPMKLDFAGWAENTWGDGTGSARTVHLETIIIRC